MIKLRKCIKCGEIKAATEYYQKSGYTCKECVKEAQRLRNKKKENGEIKIKEDLRYNFNETNVWLKGIQVMRKGELIGKGGQNWWEEKIKRHKKWLRKKRMKEEKV